MSLQDTCASDFLQFDGLEEIRYYSRISEVGWPDGYEEVVITTDPPNPVVLPIMGLPTRGENSVERAIMQQMYPGRTLQVWHCLARSVDDYGYVADAKPRDRIGAELDEHDEPTVYWEVGLVELQTLGTRNRLHCVRVKTETAT